MLNARFGADSFLEHTIHFKDFAEMGKLPCNHITTKATQHMERHLKHSEGIKRYRKLTDTSREVIGCVLTA